MAPRLLFVHAHPDDESLWTGGLIARHTRAGGEADLIVGTWAEGTSRHLELVEATAALGMTRPPIMLGYADERIPASAPDALRFCDARFDDQVREMVGHIRTLRPDAIVTYDAIGVYGHPDHIHAHRLSHAAASAAAVPNMYRRLGQAWQTRSIYEVTGPVSMIDLLWSTVFADSPDKRLQGTPDEQIDLTVDVGDATSLACKTAAIESHRTELVRSRSMKALMGLDPERRTTLLATESYLRRDLADGGCDLDHLAARDADHLAARDADHLAARDAEPDPDR